MLNLLEMVCLKMVFLSFSDCRYVEAIDRKLSIILADLPLPKLNFYFKLVEPDRMLFL